MRKLIELLLTNDDSIQKDQSLQMKELINLLSHSTEEEFKMFLEEYEEVAKNGPVEKMDRNQELLEHICTQVKQQKTQNNTTDNVDIVDTQNTLSHIYLNTPKTVGMSSNLNSASCLNSPEKQSHTSRWTIPREERRKILEQMERAREDQKRRKKADWCRLERKKSEFEEAWEDEKYLNGLSRRDLEIMRIDEGLQLPVIEAPESKRTRIAPPAESIDVTIVDFDCIEGLLNSLARDSKSSSMRKAAEFLLNTAEKLYKSDLLFYCDLKDFDQPYFMYYSQDDDLSALRSYEFEADDLGRFARGKAYRDRSQKFYQERAFRHRYISRKPYELFFSESKLLQLREEVEYLNKNSKEFHFWMTRSVAKKGTVLLSSNPLLKAFALLVVLSRTIEMSTTEMSRIIWSYAKNGPEWTLKEIVKTTGNANCGLLTTNLDSKLATQAKAMKMPILK